MCWVENIKQGSNVTLKMTDKLKSFYKIKRLEVNVNL